MIEMLATLSSGAQIGFESPALRADTILFSIFVINSMYNWNHFVKLPCLNPFGYVGQFKRSVLVHSSLSSFILHLHLSLLAII